MSPDRMTFATADQLSAAEMNLISAVQELNTARGRLEALRSAPDLSRAEKHAVRLASAALDRAADLVAGTVPALSPLFSAAAEVAEQAESCYHPAWGDGEGEEGEEPPF